MQNAAGNDVYVHITNYQNRYFGGGGDDPALPLRPGAATPSTSRRSRRASSSSREKRNVLAAQEAALTTTVDRFSVPIDFEQRFAGFAPVPVRPARPAKQMLVPGTLAYWRFDEGGANGTPVTAGQTVPDLSGHGNDLSTLVTVPGSAATALTWSNDYHPDQPGHGSLYFDGGQNPLHGAYLTTGANAPLNTETFTAGFTIEMFVKIPLDWDSNDNSWMAALSRWGESGQAGKSGGNTDPNEPIATLQLLRRPRAAVVRLPAEPGRPHHQLGPGPARGHLVAPGRGQRRQAHRDVRRGLPDRGQPAHRVANGITQLGLPWALGGYEYGGTINQIFHGWIGDVRIVNRPLPVERVHDRRLRSTPGAHRGSRTVTECGDVAPADLTVTGNQPAPRDRKRQPPNCA